MKRKNVLIALAIFMAVLFATAILFAAKGYEISLLFHKINPVAASVIDTITEPDGTCRKIVQIQAEKKTTLANFRKTAWNLWVCDQLAEQQEGNGFPGRLEYRCAPEFSAGYTVPGGPVRQGQPIQEVRYYFFGSNAVDLIQLPAELPLKGQAIRVDQTDSNYVLTILSYETLTEADNGTEDAGTRIADFLYSSLMDAGVLEE